MANSVEPKTITDGFAVTPSDTVNAGAFDALWVGGAGNVVIVTANSGVVLTFVGVAAGSIIPVAGTRVNSTSTTATSIVALRY